MKTFAHEGKKSWTDIMVGDTLIAKHEVAGRNVLEGGREYIVHMIENCPHRRACTRERCYSHGTCFSVEDTLTHVANNNVCLTHCIFYGNGESLWEEIENCETV